MAAGVQKVSTCGDRNRGQDLYRQNRRNADHAGQRASRPECQGTFQDAIGDDSRLIAEPGCKHPAWDKIRDIFHLGIMQRFVIGDKPPLGVQYKLTSFGNRFKKLIEGVRRLQAEVDKAGLAESLST